MAQDLTQVVALPAPLSPVRLARYLPAAVLEQTVEPDTKGKGQPAVELSVEGPAQAAIRWLIAGDLQRNRLISYIATWRYMAVTDRKQRDALYDQFKNELTRPPALTIARLDGANPHLLEAAEGKSAAFDDLRCKVRVKKFFPHFAMNKETKEASNLSDQRVNPAALVEVERDGKRNERWVFSEFPEYGVDTEAIPFRLGLDCPLAKQSQSLDFMLISVGSTGHEAWTRQRGQVIAQPLAVDDMVSVAGTNYKFRIKKFVPSSRLVERYKPAEAIGAVRALRVETRTSEAGPETIWLESGKQSIVRTPVGPMTIVFGPRRAGETPAKLAAKFSLPS